MDHVVLVPAEWIDAVRRSTPGHGEMLMPVRAELLHALADALERAERIETAARDLDGAIGALWMSELRYAEGRLWATVHDARERLRAAQDEGVAR